MKRSIFLSSRQNVNGAGEGDSTAAHSIWRIGRAYHFEEISQKLLRAAQEQQALINLGDQSLSCIDRAEIQAIDTLKSDMRNFLGYDEELQS